MNNKIFLIKTLEIYDGVDQNQMVNEFYNCFDDEDKNNYTIEDVNGIDYIFLRFPDHTIKKICKVLDKYIKYSIEEISHDIIFDSQDDIKGILNDPQFKPFFDKFRIEVTEMDDVLDKILSKGIGSIDDIDRMVLSKVK